MFHPIKCALISMTLFISATLSAGATEWRQYHNPRFGTVVDVPLSGFTARPPAANGDGREWVSNDGFGQILVFGDLIVMSDTVRGYRQEILGYARDDGLDIVYSAAKKNWFAYSGFLNGDIIYEKVVVTTRCDPMIGNHIYLRYPASQKAEYDAIVRRLASSLKGSRNAEMCN